MSDELVRLLEDEAPAVQAGGQFKPAWKILIVDDDEDVHAATRYALDDIRILDRSLQLDSAYSAKEAAAYLKKNRDTAVVFLDVVMETEDSGLRLVEMIRQEMGLEDIRIILRTGQAGYAPELDVITRYDINDYRAKSDLTHTRLITSLTSALRSYQQIHQINVSRAGLSQIIDATRDLLTCAGLQQFAQGVLMQIGAFLNLAENQGLIALSLPKITEVQQFESVSDGAIVAATGRYISLKAKSITSLDDRSGLKIISEAMEHHENVYNEQGIVLICDGQQFSLIVYLDIDRSISDDEQRLLTVFCQNIGLTADNLALIERLHTLAYYDELTLLPNRLSLTNAIRTALKQPKGKTLFLLDIDHFNNLHESVGQDVTERLLREYAATLKQLLGEHSSMIARISGDSFAILANSKQMSKQDIRKVLHMHLQVDEGLQHNVFSTAAAIPLDAFEFTSEQLLSAAYATLKEAKASGNRRQISTYHKGLLEEIHDNASLLQALPQAMENSEFQLHYQPKWDIKQQRFHGMEALIRWQTADGEWVSPARFIPVVESSGMMTQLGQWILNQACEEYAGLRQKIGDPGPLAINVSGAQFRDELFIDSLQSCIDRYAIPADQLTLEITETSAINTGLEDAVAYLGKIRELGVQISLDDFGTGYSSLSYLRLLPVNQLKIDRSFIRKAQDEIGQAIIRSIVEVSHSLGLSVVAEGAEEQDEVESLQKLNCNYIQGYFYARPMPMLQLIQQFVDAEKENKAEQ